MSKKTLSIDVCVKAGKFEGEGHHFDTDMVFLVTFDTEDDKTSMTAALLGSREMDEEEFAEHWAEAIVRTVKDTFAGHRYSEFLMIFMDAFEKEYDKAFKREMKGCRALLKELFGKYLDEDKEEDKEEEED